MHCAAYGNPGILYIDLTKHYIMSAYFTPDYLEFFKELAGNNHKDWFDENRKRYEREVKEPFKTFVGDLIAELRKTTDPDLLIEPKDAIFRINRDIRFSKDKTLYKTNSSALLSPDGRKAKGKPALYIELGPEYIGIYGGCYMLSPDEVAKVRSHIATHLNEFQKLLNDADFRSHFEEGIEGESQKRVAGEVKDAADKEPIIFKKQFYYRAHLDPNIIPTDKLMDTVLEYNTAAFEMREFLRTAYGD